jgi:putative flippase GtrA
VADLQPEIPSWHAYTARVPAIDGFILDHLPSPLRVYLRKHQELVKFLLVGGTAFIVDTAFFLGLKSTILETKPVTAKIISTLIATIVSYVLNREWSFRTRGGRANHHEAALFFLVSGLGVIVTTAPLWFSRYALHLEVPYVSRFAQEVADFVSAQIVGTLLAMVFRWWAFRRFVFPHADVRRQAAMSGGELDVDEVAAELMGDLEYYDEPDDVLDTDIHLGDRRG